MTERFGFADGVRAEMGTGGGRATPPSCWEGLDMAEEREGAHKNGEVGVPDRAGSVNAERSEVPREAEDVHQFLKVLGPPVE